MIRVGKEGVGGVIGCVLLSVTHTPMRSDVTTEGSCWQVLINQQAEWLVVEPIYAVVVCFDEYSCIQ